MDFKYKDYIKITFNFQRLNWLEYKANQWFVSTVWFAVIRANRDNTSQKGTCLYACFQIIVNIENRYKRSLSRIGKLNHLPMLPFIIIGRLLHSMFHVFVLHSLLFKVIVRPMWGLTCKMTTLFGNSLLII